MVINSKFDLNQKVRMKDLEWNGTVRSIYFGEKGTQFLVRYFWEGKSNECYFYTEELEEV